MRGHDGAVEIRSAHPVLAVHDLQLSAVWYRDVLGCAVREPDPGNWIFCRSGTTDFMLGRCPDSPTAWELGDHSYIAYLHVDDIDAFYGRALAAGADILKPPRNEPWGMRELGLRSPDGHRFMLGQPSEIDD